MAKSIIKSSVKSADKSTFKRNDRIEEGILNYLKKSENPVSTTDIANKLNHSWHTIIRYCLNLELKGKVTKFNLGRVAAWQIKK
jgi:Mn-dependent DtxR family transcriptional regulator